MKELKEYLGKINLISEEYVKQKIENYMYIKYPYPYYEYKVVCDKTNNIDEKYMCINIYTKPQNTLNYTVNQIIIVKNKSKELRNSRKKKIKNLDDTRRKI